MTRVAGASIALWLAIWCLLMLDVVNREERIVFVPPPPPTWGDWRPDAPPDHLAIVVAHWSCTDSCSQSIAFTRAPTGWLASSVTTRHDAEPPRPARRAPPLLVTDAQVERLRRALVDGADSDSACDERPHGGFEGIVVEVYLPGCPFVVATNGSARPWLPPWDVRAGALRRLSCAPEASRLVAAILSGCRTGPPRSCIVSTRPRSPARCMPPGDADVLATVADTLARNGAMTAESGLPACPGRAEGVK